MQVGRRLEAKTQATESKTDAKEKRISRFRISYPEWNCYLFEILFWDLPL